MNLYTLAAWTAVLGMASAAVDNEWAGILSFGVALLMIFEIDFNEYGA